MIKAAILIDGGYFLKRLPVVRPDICANDAVDVAKAVSQLIRGHLTQLNEVYMRGNLAVQQLADSDFAPTLRQKGVDMRIGLDIASITLKRQAQVIILVSGDADFVPAAKLARREGVQFVLDPLWHVISPDLFEHIDGLRSGFYKPRARKNPDGQEAGSK